jgi:chromosomal replication initiator protein
MPYSAAEVWETALGQLLLRVTRQNYDTWLRHTAGLRFDGTTLVVATPNSLTSDWLATRMRSVIAQALSAVAGPGLSISFEATEMAAQPTEQAPLQPSLLPALTPPLNPRFTFKTYLTGDFNRLAVSAAQALITTDEVAYSPLFITGGNGSGKTHLLHAIAHEAALRQKKLVLVSAERFLNEFTTSVRNRGGAAFRARYREIDLLLIDDVHLLIGKKATLAEFYQTVSDLRDEGRLVVVTGDLAAMNGDAARFQSELRWGLVAPIETPSIEDRIAFIQTRASLQRIDLPPEVQHYIALRVRSSLRELEGAVNRVAALARISREPITIDFTTRALKPVGAAASQPTEIQPTALLDAICHHLSLTPAEISSQRRDRALTYARHIAMYLLRHDAGLTYNAIAQFLHKKDHSTVVHACSQLHKELNLSPTLRADIDSIRALIHQSNTAA